MGCSGWWRRVGTIKLTNLLIDISFQLDRPSSLNWFTFSAQSKTPLVLASCCAAINLLWHFCTRLSNLGESERKQRLPYAFSRSVASGGRGLDSVGSRVKRCSVWDSDQRVVMNMKRQLRWEGGRTKKKPKTIMNSFILERFTQLGVKGWRKQISGKNAGQTLMVRTFNNFVMNRFKKLIN